MKTVSIRVERSDRIGMGHWYRCQALAKELRRRGVKLMPQASVIVTDLSHAGNLKNINRHDNYLRSLVKAGYQLVMIDGLDQDSVSQQLLVPATILVVPYVGAEKRKYKVRDNTQLLLGPDYAILREDFAKLRRKRRARAKAENILVALGGSHQPRILNKITQALKQLNWPGKQVKVIAKGKQVSGGGMAGLMIWADVGILGPGLIRYEAAAMGLPGLVIGIDKNVDGLMREFAKQGTVIYLGDETRVTQDNIIKAVIQLFGNRDVRQKMSDKGQALIDGKGTFRVVKAVIKQLMETKK